MLASRTSLRASAPRSSVFRPAPIASRRIAAVPAWQELVAAAGDVDAPIEYVIGGAIVVTVVATAIVPLVLNPGQKAADAMFEATNKDKRNPLDKRTTVVAKPKKK